jgi:hypothetical protein
MFLAPGIGLGVAAAAARILTGRLPAAGKVPTGVRLATALAALALAALLGYLADAAGARFLPGRTLG